MLSLSSLVFISSLYLFKVVVVVREGNTDIAWAVKVRANAVLRVIGVEHRVEAVDEDVGEDPTKVVLLVAETLSSATVVIGAVIRVGTNLQIKGKTNDNHLKYGQDYKMSFI